MVHRQAMADFIRSAAAWSHWFTGTHRPPISHGSVDLLDELDRREARGKPVPVTLRVAATERYLRAVAREGGVHVRYAWVTVPREHSAVHMLLNAPGMTVQRLKGLWVVGNADVTLFNPTLDAAGYMADHGGEPTLGVECDRRPRCRRRHGCIERRRRRS